MAIKNRRGAYIPIHFEYNNNNEEAWKRYTTVKNGYVKVNGEPINGIYQADNIVYYKETCAPHEITRKLEIKLQSGEELVCEIIGKGAFKKYGEVKPARKS